MATSGSTPFYRNVSYSNRMPHRAGQPGPAINAALYSNRPVVVFPHEYMNSTVVKFSQAFKELLTPGRLFTLIPGDKFSPKIARVYINNAPVQLPNWNDLPLNATAIELDWDAVFMSCGVDDAMVVYPADENPNRGSVMVEVMRILYKEIVIEFEPISGLHLEFEEIFVPCNPSKKDTSSEV